MTYRSLKENTPGLLMILREVQIEPHISINPLATFQPGKVGIVTKGLRIDGPDVLGILNEVRVEQIKSINLDAAFQKVAIVRPITVVPKLAPLKKAVPPLIVMPAPPKKKRGIPIVPPPELVTTIQIPQTAALVEPVPIPEPEFVGPRPVTPAVVTPTVKTSELTDAMKINFAKVKASRGKISERTKEQMLSLPELRDAARVLKISHSGTKNDLIDRILLKAQQLGIEV